ncbi:unnamed protein product [Microthlaspi erraticum]|uniref:Uncharacterized protein n=1 Tax=Microthlaspi erraticum TaxID=1685480 RepID=A0A6D2J6M3_9BRAS|nr:unnamed protein product [Microthlaspi erraticum]
MVFTDNERTEKTTLLSSYVMHSLMESVDMSEVRRLEGSVDSEAFPVPPQLVHITQVGVEGKAVIDGYAVKGDTPADYSASCDS